MKMELIEGSETSVISIVTPGNYPKENILHIYYLLASYECNKSIDHWGGGGRDPTPNNQKK